MATAERAEYHALFARGDWTVESVRRLRELRTWRDVPTELIPEKFRTKTQEPEA